MKTYGYKAEKSENEELEAILSKDRSGQIRSPVTLLCPGFFGIPVLYELVVDIVGAVHSSALRNVAQLEITATVAVEEPPVKSKDNFDGIPVNITANFG